MLKSSAAYSRLQIKQKHAVSFMHRVLAPRRELRRACLSGSLSATGISPVYSRVFSTSSSIAVDPRKFIDGSRKIIRNQPRNNDKWDKATGADVRHKSWNLDWNHLQRSTERILQHPKGMRLQKGMVQEALRCIRLWSRMGSKECAMKATQILEKLEDVGQANDIEMYNGVIAAWKISGDPSAAFKAQDILDKVISPKMTMPITTNKTFGMVMDAWLTCKDDTALQRGKAMLQIMEQLHRHENVQLTPDLESLNCTLRFYSRAIESAADPSEADAVLTCIEKAVNDANSRGIRPDAFSYNAVLAAVSIGRTQGVVSLEKAEVLHRLVENSYDAETGDIFRDTSSLNSLLHSIAANPDKGSAQRAEAVLRKAEYLYDSGASTVAPDTVSYTTTIHAYARQGDAIRAEDLFERMLGNSRIAQPNTVTLNCVLDAYAKSRTRAAALRAEALLHRMQELYAAGYTQIQPDTVSFASVIDAWAKSNVHDAGERAESLLRLSEKLYRAGVETVKPDRISYNTVLNAFARVGDIEAAKKADTLLEHMHTLRDLKIYPCIISCNTVIGAFSKCKDQGIAREAEDILRKMEDRYDVKPDAITYNTVMQCYAKEGNSEKCYAMLNSMKNQYKNGNQVLRPTPFSYNICMDAFSRCGAAGSARKAEKILNSMIVDYLKSMDEDLKPKTVHFNTVLSAWSRSPDKGSVRRCERILSVLLQGLDSNINADALSKAPAHVNWHGSSSDQGDGLLLDELDKESLQKIVPSPDTRSFNAVLHAYARHSRNGTSGKSESLFMLMKYIYEAGIIAVQPDIITFSILLNGTAKSREPKAAERAERVLKCMEEYHENGAGGIQPNSSAYASVIDAWANSGEHVAANQAEELLLRMGDRYKEGKMDAPPDSVVFNSTLNAIAKSKRPRKAKRCQELLNKMKELYAAGDPRVKPDVMTYTTLLNSCAFTFGKDDDKQEALSIGMEAFQEISNPNNSAKPNNVTYAMFLMTIGRLMPKGADRDALVESTFRKCCEVGLVCSLVFKNFNLAASPVLLQDILGPFGGVTDPSKLPLEWSINVQQRNIEKRGDKTRRF